MAEFPGKDALELFQRHAPVTLTGVQNLLGSDFNDTLLGDGGNNILTGGDGNDVLWARGGNDLLFGEAGNIPRAVFASRYQCLLLAKSRLFRGR